MIDSPAPPLVVDAPRDPDSVRAFLALLRAALDGVGPAVAPVPAQPDALRTSLVTAIAPETALDAPDIAAIVTTSGSTGNPKAVLLSRAALQASARAAQLRLGGPARWVLALPVHHIAGLGVLVRSVLADTDPVVLDLSRPFAAADFAMATEAAVGTRLCTSLVPTQLRRLLAAGDEAVAALRTYDAVLLGGAAAPSDLLDRARQAGIAVVTSYGMTETCGGCVYDGLPLDGVQVTTTADGTLRIAGPVLASGYRLEPELSGEAFRDGGFVTADLGTVGADGRVSVTGRADDVIVSGGENVSLPAVEAVVAGLAGVAEAAAYAVPDEQWGARVGLVVVATAAVPPAAVDVSAAVVERLGRAAAPRDYRVVDSLPLLASGKLDRAALARWAP